MNWQAYKWKSLLLWLVLIPVFNTAHSQPENSIYSSYSFKNITMDDGLPNNRVNSICQDNIGFIWFGTNEGIVRYDGYNLKVFKHNPGDSNTICDNIIRNIFLDSRNRMWIATDGGIDLYDQEMDLFRHVKTKENGRFSDICWEVTEIDNGIILFGSTVGLYQVDSLLITRNMQEKYLLPEILEVTEIFQDKQKNLYFGTKLQGLFVFDRKSDSIKQFRNKGTDRSSISGNRIESITEDNEGNIWIGTYESGLNCFHPDRSEFEWIDIDGSNNYNYRIRDLELDRFGRLWVGTYKGLFLKKSGEKTFLLYAHESLGLAHITNISIYDILIDKQDIMWLGTYSGGVNYCDFSQKKFKQYTYRENDVRYLNDMSVFSISADRDNNLWIGTEKGGLTFFDNRKKVFDYFITETKNRQVAIGNTVRSVCTDTDNNVWFGVFQDGLRCYNRSTGEIVNYRHDPSNPNSLLNNTMYSITIDDNKNLWLGTREGIEMFDRKSNRFIHFQQKPGEKYGFGKFRINVVYKDNDNNIWVGSAQKGLYLLNRLDNTFISQCKEMEEFAIVTIHRDSEGHIWAGGNEGLFYYDPAKGKFIHYTEKEGLPTNNITAIISDNSGNLWIATSNGLVKFIHAVNTPFVPVFKLYKTSQGLKVLQFANNSCFKSQSGELFFGGLNGFISFYPEEITDNEYLPSVKITGLTILNKEVTVGEKIGNQVILKKSIFTEDNISLSYKHYAFTFEFSAMHYAQSKENRYAYMLEGFDKDWIYSSSGERYATYSNLPGKEYVFKVKACNYDGVWNETPTELIIRVLPPFWETWWFISGIILFIIGLIVLFIKFREYNINQQKKILQQSVAQRTTELSEANTLLEERQEEIIIQNEELARHRNNLEGLVAERTAELEYARVKAEEADRLKSAFLANMSHEIRTPMNAIVGFSTLLIDELDQKEKEEYVKIINNNCDNLMVLINDILDISLIEANQLKIEPVSFDATAVLKELVNIYKVKNKPNVDIVLEIPDQNPLKLVTDQYRFRQILNNLLSNSMKYTEKGKIRIGYKPEGKKAVFYVSDSGIGIAKEDFEKIFDYFHKLDNSTTKLYKGTGIGLSICKKLVEILGGEIWLESEPGSGSVFYFSIPYPENQYLIPSEKKQGHNGFYVGIPGLQILIAEDEDMNFILYEKILKPLKAKIVRLKTGKEAVDFIKQNHDLRRSVIIMDIKMPEMDGIEAYHEIRKLNSIIPIIAVTAYATEYERKEIMRHGFNAYLSKPVDTDKLIDLIRQNLE